MSTEEPEWELSRYEPALAQILAAYCNNKLPEDTFPFVAGSAPPATSSRSLSARSVRTSTTWASNKQQDSGRGSRSDRPRVVFIVGGYSYMEVRHSMLVLEMFLEHIAVKCQGLFFWLYTEQSWIVRLLLHEVLGI